MAVLKNTVQVNNGNTGWNAGHVVDALEEVFGDLGWNSGTQKNGVPQGVRSPAGTVVAPDVHWAKGAADSFEHAAPAIPLRAEKTVYYDIYANSTNDAYRLTKRFYIGSTDLDVTANTFTEADHQLSTGDAVKYGYGLVAENDTNRIPELTFGTTYYVIKVDNNTFKLAASSSDATGEIAIDISAPTGSGNVAVFVDPSTITDNNDITILQGDFVYLYNFTPGVPTALAASFVNPGTGYAASGTDVATTTSGPGTGLTVDFTAFDGIIETITINTAGTGYRLYDEITVSTGNADAVITIGQISGSIGQQFTLCINTDDYAADKLWNSTNYVPYSTGHTYYPRDFSNTETSTMGNNSLKFDAGYTRQSETQKSWCPPELRFPDFDVNSYSDMGYMKYIYSSNTTSGMTGEIIIQASCHNGNSGEPYNYFDYTVPASGARGALDLRIVRGVGSYPYYDGGELQGIYILNVAEGWTTGESFTIPGDQIGGSTPTHDITFGTQTDETSSEARDGICEIRTTTLGAGSNFFQRTDNGYFGTLKLENDSTKKFGTTYYTFGITTDAQPYQMYISSGSMAHWLNRYGTTTNSTDGSNYIFYSGRRGLDYQDAINRPTNAGSYYTSLNFATATTPTAYPLKIYSYKAQSPQDDNFAIIQFVQTINEVDQQYATFYLHKGNQIGTNIWDLEHVWQGCIGTWSNSGRTLYHYIWPPNYRYYNQGPSREPAGGNTLAREAFYGYYRDSTDNYTDLIEDQYSCNIDTDNNYTLQAVPYFRDTTYEDVTTNGITYAVNSAANYYRPIKGIPMSRKCMPVPYTLPDDFVLLQVSTSPGLTNFRPGDTITVSASEVYEVVRAAWQTNQNSLDNQNDSSSMGILLLARTT